MRPVLLFALFATACGASSPATTTEPAAPAPAPAAAPAAEKPALRPAAEILDFYIEATGGRDAHLAVTSIHSVGTMSQAQAGGQGRIEIWQKAPALARVEFELEGLGSSLTVSDGTHVWESSAMTGVRLLEGAELRDQLRSFNLHAEVDWRDHYPTVETLGREEVDGEAAWAVKLVPPEGNEIRRWYSVDRGLLLKSVTRAQSPMGEIEVTTRMSDYRDHDGVHMSHRATQAMMGAELELVMDQIEVNADIPAERFAPTPAMQKLVDAAAATKPKPKP